MSWREWFEKVALVNRVIMPGGEIYSVSDAEEARYHAFKARLIEELNISEQKMEWRKIEGTESTGGHGMLEPHPSVEKPASPRPWY